MLPAGSRLSAAMARLARGRMLKTLQDLPERQRGAGLDEILWLSLALSAQKN